MNSERLRTAGALLLMQVVAVTAAAANTGSSDDNSQLQAPAEGQLEEVVVSARKRDETVLSIPESIAVVSSADLTDKGIQTVEDLGRQTPNLQLNTRQDLTTDVVIRGVGAYGDVLGVGFNIDNVPNFTDQTTRLEDIERVEILKGPQGTLYGGSSIGGMIRYVSKQPAFNYDGEASAQVGSYGQRDFFVAQNVPVIRDTLAMRVSAYLAQGDGYIANSALGIDGNPFKDYGVRAMLLFKPVDQFNALLTLRHSYIRNGADEYAPVRGVTDFTYDVPLFQTTFNTRSVNGAVLELNGDLTPGLTATSVSSYTRAQYAQNVDISFTPPDVPGQTLLTLPGERPTQVATQELRLTSHSGGQFDWLFGVYAADIRDVLLNQNAVANYPPPPQTMLINDFDTRRTDLAAFGSLNYHFGPFTLEAGSRINQTQFRAQVYTEAGGPPNQTVSITSDAVLPKISLSYAVNSSNRLYATVSKGEEPGAVNTVSTAPVPYKSETALSYEVGFKGESSEHSLQYEFATFYVNNNNHQVETNQYIAADGGLVTLIDNIGDSRTYGVEGSETWRPQRDLTIGAGAGYLNARWIKAAAFGAPINGNTIPNAPAVTATLSTAYSRAVWDRFRVEGNFEMNYTDAMWWDLPNTPGSKQLPYWLGNFRVAFGPERRNWQVAMRVSNLLNARYWTEYFPNFFPAGANPCAGCNNIGAIGAPRQYMASLSFKY